jgi:hypothetical protein
MADARINRGCSDRSCVLANLGREICKRGDGCDCTDEFADAAVVLNRHFTPPNGSALTGVE